MKKMGIGIGLMAFLLSGSLVYAQMSDMKDHGGMMGHGKMMDHAGMMGRGKMMGDMMGMTDQMSNMMGKCSGMMKGMQAGNRKNMSGLMKAMSHQMMDMSTTVSRDRFSPRELQHLRDGMTHLQHRMSDMESHH